MNLPFGQIRTSQNPGGNTGDKFVDRPNPDNEKITCAVFLDLSKAFDHQILIKKLEQHGILG